MAAMPLDSTAITRQAQAIRAAPTVPPGVWLHCGSTLEAVRRNDPETLAAALLALAAVDLSSVRAVRNCRDATLPAALWDRHQGALAMDPHASVSLHPASEREFASGTAHLATAGTQLRAADPALADEISCLIHEAVFARGEAQPGTGFGGATSFFAWGVTFLNARRHDSAVTMAVGLAHEAAHALLFAHTAGQPIVLNDAESGMLRRCGRMPGGWTGSFTRRSSPPGCAARWTVSWSRESSTMTPEPRQPGSGTRRSWLSSAASMSCPRTRGRFRRVRRRCTAPWLTCRGGPHAPRNRNLQSIFLGTRAARGQSPSSFFAYRGGHEEVWDAYASSATARCLSQARPGSAPLIALQTRSGVAGMSKCRIPSGASASLIAFIAAPRAPTVPASPTPFAPSGFTAVGTSRVASRNSGYSSARGI